MNEEKLNMLVLGVRACLIEFIGVIEDFLGIARDKSALAKRRDSVNK